MSRHRGQIRGMSGSLGYGSARDYGPDPIVDRPRMLTRRPDDPPETPENHACYCTGLRHEHDPRPRVCPAERVTQPKD